MVGSFVLSAVVQTYRTGAAWYKLALRSENYSTGTKEFIGPLRYTSITTSVFIKLTIPPLKTVYLGGNKGSFNIHDSGITYFCY